MLERAAALTPDAARRAGRLHLAGNAYWYDHAMEQAVTALAAAERVATSEDVRGPSRILRLSLGLWKDPAAAAAALLHEAGCRSDARQAAQAAALAACFRVVLEDTPGAVAAARRARAYAVDAGSGCDPFVSLAVARALVAGRELAETGLLREAALACVRVGEYRLERPEDWLQAWATVYGLVTLILLSEYAAVRTYSDLLSAGSIPGDLVVLSFHATCLGTVDYLEGRWASARTRLEAGMRYSREAGLGGRFQPKMLAQIAAARGAEEEVSAYLAQAGVEPLCAWTGFVGTGARALLALGRGENEQAVELYERDLLPLVGPLALRHEVADAIEAYLRAGRRTDALRWLEPFAVQSAESGWAWARAAAAHLRAFAAEGVDEVDAFEVALELPELRAHPFLHGRTHLAYGERLRRARLVQKAREHLHASLRLFEQLEAVPWAERAAAELRASGERVRRRANRTAELTPQELQVALVVARGATNREAAAQLFLSPKTIEKHLGSTYAKLGIRSRTELAAVFASTPAAVSAPAPV